LPVSAKTVSPNLQSRQEIDVLQRSILELQPAAQIRFAAERSFDEPPIATHTSSPLEREAAVAERAFHTNEPVFSANGFGEGQTSPPKPRVLTSQEAN
jgi:hypothetical protein